MWSSFHYIVCSTSWWCHSHSLHVTIILAAFALYSFTVLTDVKAFFLLHPHRPPPTFFWAAVSVRSHWNIQRLPDLPYQSIIPCLHKSTLLRCVGLYMTCTTLTFPQEESRGEGVRRDCFWPMSSDKPLGGPRYGRPRVGIPQEREERESLMDQMGVTIKSKSSWRFRGFNEYYIKFAADLSR